MGSFNATCMLSNLPIFHHEEVVLYLIKQNTRKDFWSDDAHNPNGYFDPTDLFTPVCMPIYGKYNGYGMIESITDDSKKVFLTYIDFLTKTGILHNDDVNYSKDIYGILNFFMSSKFFYRINFIFMKRSIHDNLIYDLESTVDFLGNSSVHYEINQEFNIVEQKILKLTKENPQRQRCGDIKINVIETSKVFNCTKYFGITGVDYNWFLVEELFNKSDNYALLKKFLIKLIEINKVLKMTRKIWVPQGGNGSQSQHFSLIERLSNYISDECEDINIHIHDSYR